MEIKANLNYLRIAPRKVRLLADLIRGKRVAKAKAILSFTPKKGSGPLKKLLASAVANAKNNFHLEGDDFVISKITIDEGAKIKRWRARSRGRANQIQKKTSHISLILREVAAPKKSDSVANVNAKELLMRKESKKVFAKRESDQDRFKKENKKKKSGFKEQLARSRVFRRKSV